MPTIAAMNGHAVGGGFGLALVCDLRVANRDAKYGANFAKLGFHSGMAISHLLPRIVGVPRAADMLFTGTLVSGAEAAAIGLVHEAVAADAVLDAALRRARAVAACAPEAVRLMKRSLYGGAGWDPRSAARAEAFAQAATMRTTMRRKEFARCWRSASRASAATEVTRHRFTVALLAAAAGAAAAPAATLNTHTVLVDDGGRSCHGRIAGADGRLRPCAAGRLGLPPLRRAERSEHGTAGLFQSELSRTRTRRRWQDGRRTLRA